MFVTTVYVFFCKGRMSLYSYVASEKLDMYYAAMLDYGGIVSDPLFKLTLINTKEHEKEPLASYTAGMEEPP